MVTYFGTLQDAGSRALSYYEDADDTRMNTRMREADTREAAHAAYMQHTHTQAICRPKLPA